MIGVALKTILGAPSKKVVVFNPSIRQSNSIIDRARSYLIRWGIGMTVCSRGELILENESSIVSRPVKASARGENCDALLLDELGWLEEQQSEDVLAVAMPYLSRPGSRLIISSTPRGRTGLFHKIWTEENSFQKIMGSVQEVKHYAPGFVESQRDILGELLWNREYGLAFDSLNETGLFTELDIRKLLGGASCTSLNMETTSNSNKDTAGLILPQDKVKTSLHYV